MSGGASVVPLPPSKGEYTESGRKPQKPNAPEPKPKPSKHEKKVSEALSNLRPKNGK